MKACERQPAVTNMFPVNPGPVLGLLSPIHRGEFAKVLRNVF